MKRRRAHAEQREAALVMAVDQLGRYRRRFRENAEPGERIRALVDGAAARGHTVDVGGQLFSDAMGPAGSYEGTYIGMIDHNVTTITRGLGGNAPQRGMQGRLRTAA